VIHGAPNRHKVLLAYPRAHSWVSPVPLRRIRADAITLMWSDGPWRKGVDRARTSAPPDVVFSAGGSPIPYRCERGDDWSTLASWETLVTPRGSRSARPGAAAHVPVTAPGAVRPHRPPVALRPGLATRICALPRRTNPDSTVMIMSPSSMWAGAPDSAPDAFEVRRRTARASPYCTCRWVA